VKLPNFGVLFGSAWLLSITFMAVFADQLPFIRHYTQKVRVDGVITGVMEFGLFIELRELLIQGLVHVRELDDDYYMFDERQYALRGRSRGRQYRLGDHVRVRTVSVNPEGRELNLAIVPPTGRNF